MLWKMDQENDTYLIQVFPAVGIALFFPPVLCSKIKEVKVSALSEVRTVLGLSAGTRQHRHRCTTAEDQQIAALQP